MSKSINAFRLVILALVITAGVIGISATAKAIETTPTEGTQKVTTESRTTTTPRPVTTNTETVNKTERTTSEQRKVLVARLEATKLKLCQNRETEIKNTLARITDRGTKRVDTLDKIAIRVEEFYVAKGKILNNYDQLVAAVDTDKAIVQTAINNLPLASTNFSCTGDNPKSVITEFKTKNLSLNTALKNYKTAIKNLIVGVKSIQGTTTSDANKSTTREQ